MNLPIFAIGMPGPFEMMIIGGVVLLLFGSRLPGAMRSLGRSVVEFKKGVKGLDENESSSHSPAQDENVKSETTQSE